MNLSGNWANNINLRASFFSKLISIWWVYHEISGFTLRKLSKIVALNTINTKVRNHGTWPKLLEKMPPRRLIKSWITFNMHEKNYWFSINVFFNGWYEQRAELTITSALWLNIMAIWLGTANMLRAPKNPGIPTSVDQWNRLNNLLRRKNITETTE